MTTERDSVLAAPTPAASAPVVVPRTRNLLPRVLDGSRAYALQVASACRIKLQRVGPTGAAGVALLFLAAALVWSGVLPEHRRVRELQEQIQLSGSGRTPLRQQPRGPADSVDAFVQSLPSRAQVPAIVAVVVQEAEKAGLSLDTGRYEIDAGQSGRIERYRLTFPVNGAYPQLRSFVDGALVAVPALAVDSLRLEREGIAQGGAAADVTFVVYVRSER